MRNTLVTAENLSKHFLGPDGPLTVLDNINFQLAHGASCAVVGASGSGKSTLLGLLAGLELPSTGRCLLDGQDLNVLDEDARARLRNQHIGFVFQQFHLLESFNALENVLLPLELANVRNRRELATTALDRVGLASRAKHLPRQLSGGEQQRVAIARAFCTNPSLLFADEPTGNLDTRTAHQIIELLFELNRETGTTLVLVTHDDSLASRCSRRLELTDGRLLGQ
ncbi:MAG: ABC transporter ATP-binding protein [Gammaproteobacteria bacterium]|nr:ABC transporter ATP-binding protein [Gammaproteobacteria bacterium]